MQNIYKCKYNTFPTHFLCVFFLFFDSEFSLVAMYVTSLKLAVRMKTKQLQLNFLKS